MKTNNFKIGSLYRVNARINCYAKDPFLSFREIDYEPINVEDVFLILDFHLYSKNKSNIFILKILFKDKIKYIVNISDNLIEVKED